MLPQMSGRAETQTQNTLSVRYCNHSVPLSDTHCLTAQRSPTRRSPIDLAEQACPGQGLYHGSQIRCMTCRVGSHQKWTATWGLKFRWAVTPASDITAPSNDHPAPLRAGQYCLVRGQTTLTSISAPPSLLGFVTLHKFQISLSLFPIYIMVTT